MYELQEMMLLAEEYPLPTLSYSQINAYQDCPHAYYLAYVAKGERQNGNKYTELGGVLHEVFEAQGKSLIFGDNPLEIGKALKMFNQLYMKIEHKHFVDKEDFIAMYQKGVQAIHNYYAKYGDITPTFVEKTFKQRIAEGLPPLKGIIDRIEGEPLDASTWVLSDYKTGSNPKSKDYLRNDLQMGIYCSLVFAETGQYPRAVQFIHPVPDKVQTAIHLGDGVYEFQNQRDPVVRFSVAETIMEVRRVVASIVTDLKAGKFNKVPEPWNCKMCWHFERCQPFLKNTGWESVGNG
jgi:CRISPR/Cas system-associated exonuclease Cas4 (RecB family)